MKFYTKHFKTEKQKKIWRTGGYVEICNHAYKNYLIGWDMQTGDLKNNFLSMVVTERIITNVYNIDFSNQSISQ